MNRVVLARLLGPGGLGLYASAWKDLQTRVTVVALGLPQG